MKLESITPNIMVKDVNETIDYYVKVLGFKLLDTFPESGIYEWGYVMLNEVGFMFQQEQSLKTEYVELKNLPIGGALTFYIRVQGVQELYAILKEKVKVVKPINKTFYGTDEFAIMDNNGYILTFSETPN